MRVIKRKQFEEKLKWLIWNEDENTVKRIYNNTNEIKLVVQRINNGDNVKGYIIPVMSDATEKGCLIIDTEYESIFKLNAHFRSIESEKCLKKCNSIFTLLPDCSNNDKMSLVLSQNMDWANIATKYTHKKVEYYMVCAKNRDKETNLRVMSVIETLYPENVENDRSFYLTTKISFPKILL